MALNFYKQSDIDAMDAGNIPDKFKNYFKSLDYAGKTAILGSRYDLAEALGFKLPNTSNEEEITFSENIDDASLKDTKAIDEEANIAESPETVSSEKSAEPDIDDVEFNQINLNSYEGKSFESVIKDNMSPLEALTIADNTQKCPLHHTALKKWQVKYTKSSTYSILVYTCEQCHRIFMYDSRIPYTQSVLTERKIDHTFYTLEITNRYLRSQMKSYELEIDEKVYVPDTWIEENPTCPIHDTELYELPCSRKYKNRMIEFTGHFCEKCNKILVRRAAAINLEDQCALKGIPVIEYETLTKKLPQPKPFPVKEVKPDYIIENGKRETYAYDRIADCFKLTEEDTVVVSDSIYCMLDGHETEEVLALIWVDQKLGGRKSYLFVVGYCAHCQKFYMDIDDYKVMYPIGRPEVIIISDIDDNDYQITSGEVFNLEKTHLGKLEDEIQGTITEIHNSPDYVNPYTTGDYDDGGLSASKDKSNRKYGQRLKDLTGYINKPYSYRVDIGYDDVNETFYIGADDIFLNDKQKVISANSTLGYKLINYQTLKVKRNGKDYNIKLSRQFDITNASLYGYVNLRTDEDQIFKSGITDPFLVRVLNMRKRQHNLTDIFVTIQENQNSIVNADFDKNIIVQGCAGSGKTMVLLHRLSSLKYKNKHFDFSERSLILTPNDQFNLHIKGLAEGLQIGNITRLSVEQYYIDMLMQYDKEFKPQNDITSEMLVPQEFVNYIYSDQFKEAFNTAYDTVINERNSTVEILNKLTDDMGQKRRIISPDDNVKAVSGIKAAVASLESLVQKQDQALENAELSLNRYIERKTFLENKISETRQAASNTIQETASRVHSKFTDYMLEKNIYISELEQQLNELTEQQEKVQKSLIILGKRAKLEELKSKIKSLNPKISTARKQLNEGTKILHEKEQKNTDEELLEWLQMVVPFIKNVRNDINKCRTAEEEYNKYFKEYSGIDELISFTEQRCKGVQHTVYSDEIKKTLQYLKSKTEEYELLPTYWKIFEKATLAYKTTHKIKNIIGKYHRYDFYAQLLFSIKYFKRTPGTLEFMCVDEGQDLAFNEYQLIYELNQKHLIFNIFGDTNQLMKPGRGIDNWNNLENTFKVQRFSLNENYRNTNQITKFCNSSFKMNILQTGVDGPTVREIPRRDLEKELSAMHITTERIAILVSRSIQKNSYVNKDFLPESISKIIGNTMDNGHISLMYVDEVKGIEFDKVFVASDKMSRNEKYIAYTRALTELILVVNDVHTAI